MEQKIFEVLSKLTVKIDKLDSDIQGMKQEQQEIKADILGMKQEQQEMKVNIQGIKQELQTFRENSEQNFTTIINYGREVQNDLKALNEKMDKELAHLELKSDVLQGEVIRIKQRQYVSP